MILSLSERLLFPGGRGFIPFPVRRCILQALELPQNRDQALWSIVRREPQDISEAPRAWFLPSGQEWMRLDAELTGQLPIQKAEDWLELFGPADSPAHERFVREIVAPMLGKPGLSTLQARETFTQLDGSPARIDFALTLAGQKIAIALEAELPDFKPEDPREKQIREVAELKAEDEKEKAPPAIPSSPHFASQFIAPDQKSVFDLARRAGSLPRLESPGARQESAHSTLRANDLFPQSDDSAPPLSAPAVARKRRNEALEAAGYGVFSVCPQALLKDPKGQSEALRDWLDALGLLGTLNEPELSLNPLTHTLLAHWPQDFVRAQQAALDLLFAKPEWCEEGERQILVPFLDQGAAILGFVDALDSYATANALHQRPLALSRISFWLGEDATFLKELLNDDYRRSLPFEIELLEGAPPENADLLLISEEGNVLESQDLNALAARVQSDGQVLWYTRSDAKAGRAKAQALDYLEHPERNVIERVLDRFFGFSAFRSGQWEIVEQLLRGTSCLGVLPTGAGKTVCFQLPALLQPGLAIVVSPLVSLMDDQVMNLRAIGLDFAGRVHGRLSQDELEEELRRFKAGEYKLFYISPERFQSRAFTKELAQLCDFEGQPVSYFVVDESHLASEWGHDFRPSYLNLPHAHAQLSPKAPIALLTATAPRQIREDLLNIFEGRGPLTAILPPTFDRPELSFEVHEVAGDSERTKILEKLLKEGLPQSLGYPSFDALHQKSADNTRVQNGGLVFAPWGKPGKTRNAIRSADIATKLRKANFGVGEFRSSSGENESQDRAIDNRHTQERFKRNELALVVATKGFGTGIDKPDIRYVIHADPPGSMESLYQEAGRAGRDGKDARSAVIWRPRHPDCTPEGKPPACVEQKDCPYELAEICSFGIQAKLRFGNQPGAEAEIEQCKTLWRDYCAKGINSGHAILPRSLSTEGITRREVIENIERILERLSSLNLCGKPWAPRDDENKPFFVENIPFSRSRLERRVAQISFGKELPPGGSDEAAIGKAIQLVYDLPEKEAQDHAAVWAVYLRARQHHPKKSPVPRTRNSSSGKSKPDVERFVTRLMTLGVALSYSFYGLNSWRVEFPPLLPSVEEIEQRLQRAIRRFRPHEPDMEPLPQDFNEAVEEALARLIRSWYDTIGVRSWETLESLEDFLGANDCRRRRIAQYMNESAVNIPSPCGHCDICGIEAFEKQEDKTLDELLEKRFSDFNVTFDQMADNPGDLKAVEGLLNQARKMEQLSAVRDRAARHLERAPFDPAPRLAAAIASYELNQSLVARRHARMLVEQLASNKSTARQQLTEACEQLPSAVIVNVLPDLASLIKDLEPADREFTLYAFEQKGAPDKACQRAAAMIRTATTQLNEALKTSETSYVA